ncbi:hypothetical protein V6N11_030565 [Hibiscus sabdariffa]|uniref:C2 domain-containing protein n=1 Tax=Hibiscus sabdariffa TaxID=183260 RepID=A0ABR1ZSW2_9ROSI
MPQGTLQVVLVSAKGLDDTDFLYVFNVSENSNCGKRAGKMDPYVLLTCRTQEQKSRVASGQGSEPEWKREFRVQYLGRSMNPEIIKMKNLLEGGSSPHTPIRQLIMEFDFELSPKSREKRKPYKRKDLGVLKVEKILRDGFAREVG